MQVNKFSATQGLEVYTEFFLTLQRRYIKFNIETCVVIALSTFNLWLSMRQLLMVSVIIFKSEHTGLKTFTETVEWKTRSAA